MPDQGQLQAEIDLGKSKISGPVLDITESSVRVRVRESVAGGARVGLRLFRPSTGISTEVPAQVVWHRPLAGGDTDLGLKFPALSVQDHLALEAACVWNLGTRDGRTFVSVHGDFTESVDFNPLGVALDETGFTPIDLDVSHVRRINSVGAIHWIDFVHDLAARPLRFISCSLEFTNHTVMSTGMVGHGEVVSVMAPYLCARCGESVACLVEIAPLRKSGKISPPMLSHDGCGGVLEFDDIPDRYFSFLE